MRDHVRGIIVKLFLRTRQCDNNAHKFPLKLTPFGPLSARSQIPTCTPWRSRSRPALLKLTLKPSTLGFSCRGKFPLKTNPTKRRIQIVVSPETFFFAKKAMSFIAIQNTSRAFLHVDHARARTLTNFSMLAQPLSPLTTMTEGALYSWETLHQRVPCQGKLRKIHATTASA